MDRSSKLFISILGLNSVLVLLLSVAAGNSASDPTSAEAVYTLCNTKNYSDGSVFSKDLSRVLTDLKRESSTSTARYYSSSYGERADVKVNGAYQCRGDVSPDVCSQCVGDAVQTALDSCPNAIGSRVQLDSCFLRYENYSFFTEDSSIVVELCNTQKDNSTAFQRDIKQLLSKVVARAPKNNGYAATSANLSSSTTSGRLYALAQCLGYLSDAECSDCLSAHPNSWQDCDDAVGAQVHSVSCYYRFETYSFYNVSA